MIGLGVDSNSQRPPSLAERFGTVVGPMSVTIDGVDYLQGVDITASE